MGDQHGTFIVPLQGGAFVRAFYDKKHDFDHLYLKLIDEHNYYGKLFPSVKEMQYIRGLFWEETDIVLVTIPPTNINPYGEQTLVMYTDNRP